MKISTSMICACALAAVFAIATLFSSYPAASAGLSSPAGVHLAATGSTTHKHLAKSKTSQPPPDVKKFEVPKAPRTTPERGSSEISRKRSGAPSYSSGQSCSSCRTDCYERWRTNCGYTSKCKTGYASCMRRCAQNHC